MNIVTKWWLLVKKWRKSTKLGTNIALMTWNMRSNEYIKQNFCSKGSILHIFCLCIRTCIFVLFSTVTRCFILSKEELNFFFFRVFAFNKHPKVAQCCDFLCSLHINHYPTTYDYSKLTDDETSFNSVSEVRNPSYFYFSCTFKLYNTFHYVKRLLSTFWPYQKYGSFSLIPFLLIFIFTSIAASYPRGLHCDNYYDCLMAPYIDPWNVGDYNACKANNFNGYCFIIVLCESTEMQLYRHLRLGCL